MSGDIAGTGHRRCRPGDGGTSSTPARLSRPPRSPDQERRGDGHWLADVEARFDGGREVTVDASVANSSPASAPDSQTGAKRQPVRGLKAEPGDGEQPDDSVAPAVDHWLADVEATYERETSVDPTADNWLAGVEPADVQGDARDETPSTAECQTPGETRVKLDDWFDDMEEVVPLQRPAADVRRHVERREQNTEAGQPGIRHPDVPVRAARHDTIPATAVPVADIVSRLSDMDADLVRVGNTFTKSDAAFSRLVSRWHPGAVSVGRPAAER